MKKEIILQVKQVSGGYYEKNFWGQNKIYREILHDINFEIYSGEIVGLIGESGAGKSTLAKIILGLIKPSSGEVINYTKRPQIIFQDPYSSLNPAYTIKRILEEPLRIKKRGRDEREQIVHSIIRKVGLEESFLNSKPGNLSGGQLQRINIAMALIQNPKFIICDEPVSSLDLATQTKILDLFSSVQKEFGISYLFISHDLSVVYKICDKVLVMKDGKIVEQGKTKEVFDNPVHEYTKQLIDFM